MLRSIARAVACATLFLILASPVLGHSELLSADPGPDDEVIGSPTELVARFSQDLDPSRTSMSVRDSAGTVVAEGGELGDDPREVRLALPELGPGEYQVRYTTFSAEDGELHRDDYVFTVLAAPSPSPTPTPSPTAPPSATPTPPASPSPTSPPTTAPPVPTASPSVDPASGTDGGGAMIAILLALAVVGTLGVWLLRRRGA